MKFCIYTGAGKIAEFKVEFSAHQYARWLSESHHCTTEVVYVGENGDLVGQYKHGEPTAEFIGRGDEHYPAGPK